MDIFLYAFSVMYSPGASAFTVFNRCMGLALAGCAYFMFHAFYLHVTQT